MGLTQRLTSALSRRTQAAFMHSHSPLIGDCPAQLHRNKHDVPGFHTRSKIHSFASIDLTISLPQCLQVPLRIREPRFILPWASSMGTLLRHFPHQTASRIFVWAQFGISSHLARASGVKSGNFVVESVIFHLPSLSAHRQAGFHCSSLFRFV